MKETRDLKIMFAKSGSGSQTCRITVPISIIRNMGISELDREVQLTYDETDKTITIKKK